MAEERFWLGAKDQCAARGAVERFGTGHGHGTKAVHRFRRPRSQAKMHVQAADKILPIVQIGAENNFRIGKWWKKHTRRL